MSVVTLECVRHDAPIRTWFRVGGRADALATPGSMEELRSVIDRYAGDVRVLGDGANLLVDDDGVGGVVVSLKRFDRVREVERDGDRVTLRIGAGKNLPKLILDTVRSGLGGLEGLGGVPATVGGAVRMNAGGAFGEIGRLVQRVRAVDQRGGEVELGREQLAFSYRSSGLEDLIITEVDLSLTTGVPASLRAALKDVMAYKKTSQPMADKSAGCVFRNPLVDGERLGAGMLIDRAGCKGMRVGGARVSDVHANFIVTEPGAAAQDVIRLIELVRNRVSEHSGIELETEVVIWTRGSA